MSWYQEQPAGMIRSTSEEVIRDVDEIVEWAYDDAFVIQRRRKAMITEIDVAQILSLKRRSERMTLFLLMVYTGAGWHKIKENSIAKRIGMSRTTVIKALRNLERQGLIRRTYGGKQCIRPGVFASASARYDVCRTKAPPGTRCVHISTRQIQEDFQGTWTDTLAALSR